MAGLMSDGRGKSHVDRAVDYGRSRPPRRQAEKSGSNRISPAVYGASLPHCGTRILRSVSLYLSDHRFYVELALRDGVVD